MNNIKLSADIPIESLEWRNHFEIYRWCRQPTLLSSQDHNNWLQSLATDKTKKMFGIERAGAKKESIGVCGLTSIDPLHQKAEFSLYIAPEYQKKGFGKEALTLLLKVGFDELNLNRIWGETFHGNPALQLFKKLGMHLEGTQRQAYFKQGKFIDSHIVSILRSEWEQKYVVADSSTTNNYSKFATLPGDIIPVPRC